MLMFGAAFLTLLILLVFLFVLFLFLYPVKVDAIFNSETQHDMHIIMSWLNPLLKAFITRDGGITVLKVHLFGKKVYERKLTDKNFFSSSLKKRKYIDYVNMVKSLKVNNAKLAAAYGFSNPAVTGIACGVINLVSEYINIRQFYNNPDFFSETSYFNINAEAEVNAGLSLIGILRRNKLPSDAHALSVNR